MPQRQPCGAVVKPGGLDRTGPLLVDVKHTIVCDEPKPYWRRNRFMGWILGAVARAAGAVSFRYAACASSLSIRSTWGGIGYTE